MKSNAQAGLSLFKKVLKTLVCFFCSPKTRILSHSPQSSPVHRRLHAPGERIFSRETQFFIVVKIFHIHRGIKPVYFRPRYCGKLLFSFRKPVQDSFQGASFPLLDPFLNGPYLFFIKHPENLLACLGSPSAGNFQDTGNMNYRLPCEFKSY